MSTPLHVTNRKKAYVENISPHATLYNLDNGISQLLHFLTLYSNTMSTNARKAQIAHLQKFIATEDEKEGEKKEKGDMVALFHVMQMKILMKEGKTGEAEEKAKEILKSYPHAVESRENAFRVLAQCGNVQACFGILKTTADEAWEVAVLLNAAVENLEKSICAPGKNVSRGLSRYLMSIEKIEKSIDRIIIFIGYFADTFNDEFKKEVCEVMEAMGIRLVSILMHQAQKLQEYISKRKGRTEIKEIKERIGSVMLSHARLSTIIKTITSPKSPSEAER
jgi:CRISPR/Cas system CSM-associated protein Csm2 small subunit